MTYECFFFVLTHAKKKFIKTKRDSNSIWRVDLLRWQSRRLTVVTAISFIYDDVVKKQKQPWNQNTLHQINAIFETNRLYCFCCCGSWCYWCLSFDSKIIFVPLLSDLFLSFVGMFANKCISCINTIESQDVIDLCHLICRQILQTNLRMEIKIWKETKTPLNLSWEKNVDILQW